MLEELRVWLLGVFVVSLCLQASAAPGAESGVPPSRGASGALRALVSESWSMPVASWRMQGGEPHARAGFMLRWYQAVARGLGLNLEYVVRPRRRIEDALRKGEADLVCLIRPEWISEPLRSQLQWMPVPFSETLDQLVAGPGVAPPASLDGLQGERIGTVLGFVYESLQPLFEQGLLVRDDAISEAQLAEKLLRGHNRYAMMERAQLNYLARQSTQGSQLRATGLALLRRPVFCALAQHSAVNALRLESVQSVLSSDPSLQRALKGL